MFQSNKQTGQQGEDIACEYLQKKGYEIIGRNVRFKVGEVDILARDKNCLVIVEVKAGKTGQYDLALLRIGPNKIQKLKMLALAVSQQNPNYDIRIDAINVDSEGKVMHIVSAVEE